MSEKSIIVIISDKELSRIHEIAEELKSKGLFVKSIAPICGVILGNCPAEKIANLQFVNGVDFIEEEHIGTLSSD